MAADPIMPNAFHSKTVRMQQKFLVFRDKHPLIGPIFWALSVQYYVTQYFVAANWKTPFSLLHNTISDLGNTNCGMYGDRFVCSAGHNYMNASFIVLGIAMITGSVFIYPEFKKSVASKIGFAGMAIAGFGTVLVGFFPENTISAFHVLGAALAFLAGNIALLIFSRSLYLPKWFALITFVFGAGALIALYFFITKQYGHLDIGGVERIVAYPQSIWLTLFGIYMSANRYMARRRANISGS